MTGDFIIKYAGSPVQLPNCDLVPADKASVFVGQVDAWHAVSTYGIPVRHVQVVPLDTELAQTRIL